jgi:hypothetical protein
VMLSDCRSQHIEEILRTVEGNSGVIVTSAQGQRRYKIMYAGYKLLREESRRALRRAIES